jgi:hypothetical protein
LNWNIDTDLTLAEAQASFQCIISLETAISKSGHLNLKHLVGGYTISRGNKGIHAKNVLVYFCE